MLARSHSLRTLTAGALLATPLLAVPLAVPAVAADWRPYGPPGMPAYSAQVTTTEPATASESEGVVLIDTELDYGTGEAAGTGLVLTSDGTVVTNHHVVEGSTSITVTDPSTGTTYDADLVGYDAAADIAVLQLQDASGLTTIDPDRTTSVGEDVTAVGNAGGTGTLSAADGSVTATGADIQVSDEQGGYESLSDLIQVDATVISGDSGGALLDADDEVIGMNVAASTGYVIEGYAIPISTVLSLADRIEAGDTSGGIELGYGAALGIQVYAGSGGLQVGGVVRGGAADDAGLTAGSTLTSVDGTAVDTVDQIAAVLAEHAPGDSVRITWTDSSGSSHTARATLGQAPVA
ncbi:S1C family serine protease [Nocardioides sp.]|uniref:S1C family serine protease n=1 Tax=Nocardioides sp. TaxID=35761 RepID=UPI0035299238